MADFDRWQKWARDLSPGDQANACAALGMVAASSLARAQLVDRRAFARLDEGALVTARMVIASPILEARRTQLFPVMPSVRWTLPTKVLVELPPEIPPALWAAAWASVLHSLGVQPRLTLVDLPVDEPVAPWIDRLAAATPPAGAIRMEIAPPSPQLFVTWPLRLATLPGNAAAPVVDAVRTIGPLDLLTDRVVVSREEANSDVLVHVGSADDLAKALRTLRVNAKTDLIVLAGSGQPTETASKELLEATHASGIVAVPTPDADRLRSGLSGFLFTLSHNQPFDHATLSFVRQTNTPAGIWLSDALAELRLEDVARAISASAERRMPPAAAEPPSPPPPAPSAPRPRGATRAAPPPRIDVDHLEWEHEIAGARDVAMASRDIERDVDRAHATEAPERRFLQQQSFVRDRGELKKADGGFVAGQMAEVRVAIGPEDEAWDSAPERFPEELLPREHAQWRLTAWLTEPTHLESPLRGTIILPRQGKSSQAIFQFTPREAGPFEGRITVLHRGRVLQTALLLGAVRRSSARADAEATPRIDSLIPVRRKIGDLDRRRQFDVAFVFNKTTTGVPRMVALSDKRAWVTDLDTSKAIVDNIYQALSEVEQSVASYANGLDDEKGRAFLVNLAREGRQLHTALVTQQLNATNPSWSVADEDYLQVVHTKPDGVVPLEFIYDHASPARTATVCAHWRATLQAGSNACTCDKTDRTIVCPLGFWGIRKVIERHMDAPGLSVRGGVAYVQSEPGRATTTLKIGGTPLVARSQRVNDAALQPLLDVVKTRFRATPSCPSSWAEWVTMVKNGRPRFLLALPHTDGHGASASLEINNDPLESADVTPEHVYIDPDGPPLVALLGCDTAGTADDYGPHIMVFREHGAAVVVATVATVFGDHAPKAAQLLVEQLLPETGDVPRLGEALRAVKQKALLENLLMPLCLIAYGDADWQLTR